MNEFKTKNRYPVDKQHFPEYYQLIQKPMDFQTLKKNVRNGKYKKIQEFEDDLF